MSDDSPYNLECVSLAPRDVHIERVKVTTAALHCFSPSEVFGFWLEDSEANDCWYGWFDAEPTSPNTIKNVVVEGNSMKTHGGGIAFDHVEGGSIRDNRIDYDDRNCQHPLKTPFVRVSNSTEVTEQDNGPNG